MIKQLTSYSNLSVEGTPKPFAEKNQMVRAARKLLSAITKVLLIADKVIVKHLIVAKDRVSTAHWFMFDAASILQRHHFVCRI